MVNFDSLLPPAVHHNISEAEFRQHFPRPFRVQSFDVFQALARGLPTDRTFWTYLEPFEFVSAVWGSLLIPAGFVTDFASIPLQLRSVYDDDSPILLFPSAPHDLLFTRQADGSRGWIPGGAQLSLTETNRVLTEAMMYCGADIAARTVVFGAVELGNEPIRDQFRH